VTPLPAGFRLTRDQSLRRFADGRVLVGGTPLRVLRLTQAGRTQADGLLAGALVTARTGALARRLLDAGLAHPRPPEAALKMTVTTVIPVRDRAAQLDSCLTAVAGTGATIVVDDGSSDAEAVVRVCAAHRATLIRRDRNGGPAAARNVAIAGVRSDLIAFVDSDAIPEPGWLAPLISHFADPAVGAVAPRISPADSGVRCVIGRYSTARSPLDLGAREALVAPPGRVPYVPTAALVVRRSAAADTSFDEQLRLGEDVDFVWRLIAAGWRVRYDPRVVVRHQEPATWRALLGRRHRYGRSAALVSKRHPRRIVHLVIAPLPTAAALLLLTAHGRAALVAATAETLVLARATGTTQLSDRLALRLAATRIAGTTIGFSRTTIAFGAPLLAAGLLRRRTRTTAAGLLLTAPIAEYLAARPRLNPVAWLAARTADEFAYGTGVIRGCIGARTVEPLRPRWLGFRPRQTPVERPGCVNPGQARRVPPGEGG
jgi:mycofactocin system glycosyltransferase